MEMPAYELWQTEWCPASHRVRQRLTELGLDCVLRQVEPEPQQRQRLKARTGETSVPVLCCPDGRVVVGEEAILTYLASCVEEPPLAAAHRERAKRAFQKLVEQETAVERR
jgi:glutathione S-transferase